MFTAQSGCYSRLIHQASPGTQVYAQGYPMLARIIEDGNFDQQRINEELKNTLGHLSAGHPDLDALILGCTHFHMVLENIQKLYPQFTYFINPAATQARQMKEYLEETGGLNPDGQGTFGVYTTSDQKFYYDMTRYIGLKEPLFVDLVPAPKPLEK